MKVFQRVNQTANLLILLTLVLFSTTRLSAQCIPDTVNCVDTTGNPGEFCPMDLPEAGLGLLYDETVTIIPPGNYPVPDFGEVDIHYIEIDSVTNLPPGIDYFPNADIFFPDTAYCIQLTGTPTQTGTFALAIYIKATIDFLGNPFQVQVVDDSSVVITVVAELGMAPDQGSEFRVIPNVPNPFPEQTRLAFYTPTQNLVSLYVYNILGSLVHQESELAAPGTHDFIFSASELPPGTYLYRVETREQYFTGKFMKSR